MKDAAANLEFEEAARLRDEIRRLENMELGVAPMGPKRLAARIDAAKRGQGNAKYRKKKRR